jgi:hypothetical protein
MSKGALKIEDKPIPANMTAWTAFHMLRGSRQIGYGGVSPIPFSEIMAYCNHVGLDDPMERQQLAKFVMALDWTERNHYGNSST